jgi:hypothetical protein
MDDLDLEGLAELEREQQLATEALDTLRAANEAGRRANAMFEKAANA